MNAEKILRERRELRDKMDECERTILAIQMAGDGARYLIEDTTRRGITFYLSATTVMAVLEQEKEKIRDRLMTLTRAVEEMDEIASSVLRGPR